MRAQPPNTVVQFMFRIYGLEFKSNNELKMKIFFLAGHRSSIS